MLSVPTAGHGTEPEDVLDPRHYAEVRKPGASLGTFPLWCYTSQRFFDAEMRRMFLPTWNLLERVELRAPSRRFPRAQLHEYPAVVVRGGDDRVRVFANTCRHRGTMLVEGQD